jgi:hypothetical protein
MSKIGVIKETLENVFSSIDSKNINITCIFFNNEYHIATTLDMDSSYRIKTRLSITDMIQSIRKIKCNGYTDFDQISTALEKIPLTNDKMISIIATDGYHTSYLHNTDEIGVRFENFFDLSIGIGHTTEDFDKVLVQYISKDFIFGSCSTIVQSAIYGYIGHVENNKSKLFHFLFPPNTDLLLLDSFKKEYIEEPKFDNSITKNNKILYSWSEGNTINLCQVLMKTNKLEVKEPIHLIFVIDVSGSMDDYLAEGNEIVTIKTDINLEDSIHNIKTKNKWIKLNILKPDENLFFIFNNKFKGSFYLCSDTDYTEITTPESLEIDEIGKYSDSLVEICYDLINYKKLKNRDVQSQWLNNTYTSLSQDINILYPEFYDKIVSKVKYLFYNDMGH